jgi:hypothetical protein
MEHENGETIKGLVVDNINNGNNTFYIVNAQHFTNPKYMV